MTPLRFPRIDHQTMLAAFAEIAKTGLPVALHNEDQELVEQLSAEARAPGKTDAIMHARTRPPIAESMADLEIFEIGLQTGAHVHIAHSSIARGFDLARAFRGMGMQATGEACIQYLCMTEDDLVRLGGRGKCNPPFRTAEEVERMWERLQHDLVAYVSTDHAPWPADRKVSANIFECGAGLTGMQSFAPLMFTLLDERGLSPTLMATYCAERPAKLHGLYPRKGGILLGADCDLLVLERGRYRFDEADIQDRPELRWSPYHGREMRARVVAHGAARALDLGRHHRARATRRRPVHPPGGALMARMLRVAAAQMGPNQRADRREAILARMLDLLEQAAARAHSWWCFRSWRSRRSFRAGCWVTRSCSAISSAACRTRRCSRCSTGRGRSASASMSAMRS